MSRQEQAGILFALTLAHFSVDGVSGAALAAYAVSEPYYEPIVYYFGLYNLIAFGGQWCAGWIFDKQPRTVLPALFVAAAFLAVGLAPSFPVGLRAACLGVGNCVFHAAAFSWRGRAWLLTAPSGTGKTTQYLNWQRLFPGEIQMISGDMPILEAKQDGSLWVYPSSWNGKENIFGAPAAPLGGLVFLEQGKEDRMLPFPPHDAVIPLLRQFMVVPESEEEILQLTSLLERILVSVPCRKFVNLGGDASTILLRDTFSHFLAKED